MKTLLAFLSPVAYIWLACYFGIEVLPDGWDAAPNTHWWTIPTVITFGGLGFLSLVPLMVVVGTRNDYDEYP